MSIYLVKKALWKKKRTRVFWTDNEVDELKRGVKIYGLGDWAAIKKHCDLPRRSACDIKDKCRNLGDAFFQESEEESEEVYDEESQDE